MQNGTKSLIGQFLLEWMRDLIAAGEWHLKYKQNSAIKMSYC